MWRKYIEVLVLSLLGLQEKLFSGVSLAVITKGGSSRDFFSTLLRHSSIRFAYKREDAKQHKGEKKKRSCAFYCRSLLFLASSLSLSLFLLFPYIPSFFSSFSRTISFPPLSPLLSPDKGGRRKTLSREGKGSEGVENARQSRNSARS